MERLEVRGAMRRRGGVLLLALAAGLGSSSLHADEYDVWWEEATGLPDLPAAWVGVDASSGVRTYFTESGIRIAPAAAGKPWELRLDVAGWGRPGQLLPLGAATHAVAGNRITLLRSADVTEWYVNAPGRLEQFFELSAPPPGELGLAQLDFALSGLTLKADDKGRSAVLHRAGGEPVLAYEVSVSDVDGREVSVRLETIAGGFSLVLDDSEAYYPLTVAANLVPLDRAAAGEPSAPLAPPSNDLCDGAEIVPPAGPFPYLTAVTADITDATTTADPPTPSCQSDISRSIWYSFTPATSGNYTISSCADAPTGSTVDDIVLAVYTSSDGTCGGTLTQVAGACDDDSCTTESLQAVIGTVSLNAGTNYYIVAWKFNATAPTVGNTAVQLRISQAAGPPANDQCGGAEVIPASGPFPHLTAVTPDISGATSTGDPALPSCQTSVSRSIWYTFTPATTATYEISSCADAPTGTTVDDTVIAVYTSSDGTCGGALTQVAGACDDDSCSVESLQAVIGTTLTAGTPYFIVVHKFGTTAPTVGNTAVQLRVNQAFAPGNDQCAAPVPLSLAVPTAGTVAFAANDYQLSGSGCFTGVGQTTSTAPGRDVVYSFTAPDAGLYSFRATGVNVSNPVLYVASTCPSGSPPVTVGTCVAAANRNSSTSTAGEEAMCVSLAASQEVFVFLDEHVLTAGGGHNVEVTRCVRESEPNGTPATANAPVCGVEGSIAPAADADFFTLGSALADARVFAMADGIAGNSNDFDMRITTATDTLEYDDTNLDVPFGSLAPTCDGTKSLGGETFVRMNHFSSTTQSEPYRLYAVVQPPSAAATAEVEPNGTIPTAQSASNNYFAGVLPGPAPSTDVDLFKVQPQPDPPLPLQPGDLIFAALDADPEFDSVCTNARLEVRDAAGTIVATVNDGGSTSNARTPVLGSLTSTTPAACAEALTYRVKVAGDYYVAVSIGTTSTGTSGAGSYLLSLAVDCTASCDDGNPCTTNDFVAGGACTGGPPTNCDDGDASTVDNCSPETGCVHTPIECDDGLFCNGFEISDPDLGCLPGTPPNCDDGIACTIDGCDEVGDTCTHEADDRLCDDGDLCTVDVCDEETGCVNTLSPDPESYGYWQQLCDAGSGEDSLTQQDAECVNDSATFAGVRNVDDLCATLAPIQKLHSSSTSWKCTAAEQQLMALLLNRCRYRVCDAQEIESSCSDNTTVGESVAEADGLLSDPSRTFADCELAECEAEEINTGEALGLDVLAVGKAADGALRLSWQPVDGQGSSVIYQVHRRLRGATGWTFVGATSELTYDVPSAGDALDHEYEVRVLLMN